MPDVYVAPPPAKTPLGRYRALAPSCGLRVSPLQFGGASIGDTWGNAGWTALNKEASFKLLDAYYETGGNFIDTANFYQDETSEELIGEWAEQRGIRDQLVIATKYSGNMKNRNKSIPIQVNYAGTNTKSLKLSVEASLKKLRTHYIDILYIHFWDFTSPIEDVMNSLHHLVASGHVLYLGASNTPAWVVAHANAYARQAGKTPFVIYQARWNILERGVEREIMPMVRTHGMALAAWDALAGGRVRTDEEERRRAEIGEKGRAQYGQVEGEWRRSEKERKVCKALERVAREIMDARGKRVQCRGTNGSTSATGPSGGPDCPSPRPVSIQAVALAYLMHKTTHVFPVLGLRKLEHLTSNIEALSISLSDAQMVYLESILPFDPGFPSNLLGDGTTVTPVNALAGQEDKWPLSQPIRPHL